MKAEASSHKVLGRPSVNSHCRNVILDAWLKLVLGKKKRKKRTKKYPTYVNCTIYIKKNVCDSENRNIAQSGY